MENPVKGMPSEVNQPLIPHETIADKSAISPPDPNLGKGENSVSKGGGWDIGR